MEAFTPAPPRNLKEKYLALCGPGVQSPDWRHIINELNRDLALGLTAQQCEVLELIYGVLGNVLRGRGHPNMPSGLRDSNALHQILTSINIDQDYRETFPEAYNGTDSNYLRVLEDKRHRTILEALVHDCGEAWGELATASEQAKPNSISKEQRDEIERWAFEMTLRGATNIAAMPDSKGKQARIEEYRRPLHAIQSALSLKHNGALDWTKLNELLRATQFKVNELPINDEAQALYEFFGRLYFQVERPQEKEFADIHAKVREKMQGQEYFFDIAEGKISSGNSKMLKIKPYSQTKNSEVLLSLERIQKGLGELAALAATPEEQALAQRVVDACYDLTLKGLELAPIVIHRDPQHSSYKASNQKTWSALSKARAPLTTEHFIYLPSNFKGELSAMIRAAQTLGVVPPLKKPLITMFSNFPEKFVSVKKKEEDGYFGSVSKEEFLEEMQRQYELLKQEPKTRYHTRTSTSGTSAQL